MSLFPRLCFCSAEYGANEEVILFRAGTFGLVELLTIQGIRHTHTHTHTHHMFALKDDPWCVSPGLAVARRPHRPGLTLEFRSQVPKSSQDL